MGYLSLKNGAVITWLSDFSAFLLQVGVLDAYGDHACGLPLFCLLSHFGAFDPWPNLSLSTALANLPPVQFETVVIGLLLLD